MVLWYGQQQETLRNFIFHDTTFLVSVLQSLFRHDLLERLKYDHEIFRKRFPTKSEFEAEVSRFVQTGIIHSDLLRCIWKPFHFSNQLFDTMIEILSMLELCYRSRENTNSIMRLPWFIQNEDMSFLKDLWPDKLPPCTLQYTLTYCFCHRIPGAIYERFCVRLQRHLQKGCYTRMDRKNAVYIEQNRVKLLFQRHPNKPQPFMEIHIRCFIEDILELKNLFLSVHQDISALCKEYPGLYIDSYFWCPHCLFTGSAKATKRPLNDINRKKSLDWVPCDPFTPGSVQIPAAIIFLQLFGQYNF